MNPQLYEHYKRELQHAREMGGVFAAEFPKVAGRLGIETLECSDPYVERLLEGFAFMAARVQLKIDSSYGQLARHILEMVYPNSLSPTPSMLIAEFQPSLTEGSLAKGFTIKRGTRLRGLLAPGEQTECDFRTSHNLTMWPIEVADVVSLRNTTAIETAGVVNPGKNRSALSLSLRTVGGHKFSDLAFDELSFHLCGSDSVGTALYEQLFSHTREVVLACNGKQISFPGKPIKICRQGFHDDEALLPVTSSGFQGYRLLQEYFNFPDRFQFLKVEGLQRRLRQCNSEKIELVFLFDNNDDRLADLYSKNNFRLHAVPAINLFPKTADRIHLGKMQHEYHLVPDRTRPMDFEVYSVNEVEALGSSQSQAQKFYQYYSVNEKRRTANTFFSIRREPRLLSSKQKQRGTRASYVGSEIFLSLVDASEAPYRTDLRQLSVNTLCTNRDLPLQMPFGLGSTDFSLDIGAPVDAIRCLAGPTIPKPSRAYSRDAWRLVSNLNLNYLSISGEQDDDGAAAAAMLRQILEMYVDENADADRRQLEGILSVKTHSAIRQRSFRGHVEIAHGLEIRLRLDESAFEGTGVYLLGSVFERFFARYAGINSFTETVLESIQRNEIERWPVRLGMRQAI
ncbi:MAG: type VI secretion system baseplate subunit TssF [Granulosicoccus sp.]